MHKFGSTGIVTGYIKQLLSSFHLPKTYIYTDAHERFYNEHGYESPYLVESILEPEVMFPEGSKIELVGKDELKVNNVTQVHTQCYMPYLRNGSFQLYLGGHYDQDKAFVPGKWQSAPFDIDRPQGGLCALYERNMPVLNLTKQFQIKNNIYDSYTHEYLGDYLRFIRDYDGIDLMPLYNCFSNNSNLNIKLVGSNAIELKNGNLLEIDTTDPNYRLYAVPVKLFQNYTIAIDSNQPIEFFCGLYNTEFSAGVDNSIVSETYLKKSNLQFNKPFLYTALTDLAVVETSKETIWSDALYNSHLHKRQFLAQLTPHLTELKLFLKVPKQVDSSIVILEGDYLAWNDSCASIKKVTQSWTNFDNETQTLTSSRLVREKNHTVLANEAIYSDLNIKLISPLQLLQFNTGTHSPFSDRLLEYLLDNCISCGDTEVRENVLMAQTLVSLKYSGKTNPKTWKAPKLNAQPRIKVVKENQQKYFNIDGKTQGEVPAGLDWLPVSTRNKAIYLTPFIVANDKGKACWAIPGEIQETSYLSNTNKEPSLQELKTSVPYILQKQIESTDEFEDFIVVSTQDVNVKVQPEPLQYNLLNGVWDDALRKIFYQHMSSHDSDTLDILGYIDKDVEKTFVAIDASAKQPTKRTMLNFDTWEDIQE